MSDIYVLQLATRNAQWLSQREALIARNVANASTPGYRARDVLPFSKVLEKSEIGLAATNAAHQLAAHTGLDPMAQTEIASNEETLSGNSVNLEQQMSSLGEVNRAYALNTNLTRALHQMIMSVSK